MEFSTVRIGTDSIAFLRERWQENKDFNAVNQALKDACGIVDFFETVEDYDFFKLFIYNKLSASAEPDRAEYGDFQTNRGLANRIVKILKKEGLRPDVVIEPTFGKGNFILAALNQFPQLQHVEGVEIYKPYIWETKFAILDFFLQNPSRVKPKICLRHQDVFDVDFENISNILLNKSILILGNPPWVTNAKLSILNSGNLPVKSNFKKLNGLDAMTGKGNFDIGEYITLMLLRAFQNSKGRMAFLVKNSVIRNIVFDQGKLGFKIADMRQYFVDAKKEFNVSVDASLFSCQLNQISENQCSLVELEANPKCRSQFGWWRGRFVASLQKYQLSEKFDGHCPFEWRQGLKHDCSEVMELNRMNGHFCTRGGTEVHLENDLVHGILKSSDLKGGVVKTTKKFTIVTQRKVGQDTSYIQSMFPKTYEYLRAHQEQFANRKSSIYQGKPAFSIFGIGDYSFSPFKVAISGLYKIPSFTLVLPDGHKPLMLDDTCYFIGFDKFSDAAIAYALLNHAITIDLLSSITFSDAKRIFTKEVLMRIDLTVIAEVVGFEGVNEFLKGELTGKVTEDDFLEFQQSLSVEKPTCQQLSIF